VTGRRWGSTARTRAQLLDAARDVFARRGYAEASIAEVVETAGSSVGSLYHHFGGKAELFTALWERYRDEQHHIAAGAVTAARERGETDPFALFEAGARAFLGATWAYRDLVTLLHDGDTPPGFQRRLRASGEQWVTGNLRLLGADDRRPESRVLVALLTSFTGEARREIAAAGSEDEAHELVAAMTALLGRIRPVITAELYG
jgi:AcrR family transcriptional regulator